MQSETAEGALAQLVRAIPFFSRDALCKWMAPSGQFVAIHASHRPSQTGHVAYTHFESDRIALYSGRPFVWMSDFCADGRRPLDASFYLRPSEEWSERLDGRAVAANYDDVSRTLNLWTDPLGAYHVFVGTDGQTKWFSNNSEVIRVLVRGGTYDPLTLASFAACGWSLGGQPPWREVRRLPPGMLHRFQPAGESQTELLRVETVESSFGGGFDASAAAKILVETVSALANWPDRPSFVPVTGGRDSRLIFAAALSAAITFEARIGVGDAASEESPDVRTARALCELAGRKLTVAHSRTAGTVDEAARILRLTAPGTLSLEIAWPGINRPATGLPDGRSDAPLPLVHTGHGGEIARLYYGTGRASDPTTAAQQLYRKIAHVWPKPLLTPDGAHLVRTYLSTWATEQLEAGVAPSHLPDLLYLRERMANWAGASHGFDEYMTDLTSPLWTSRLLPHEFGLTPDERSRELFHYHILKRISADFARAPFAGTNPSWPTFGPSRNTGAQRTRTLTAKAQRELSRRREYFLRRRNVERPAGGLAEATRLARERTPDRSHEVWDVLNHRRSLALLRRDPSALDPRSRRMCWRIATLFLACLE